MNNVNFPDLPKIRRYTDKSITNYMTKQETSSASQDIKKQYQSAYSQINEAKDLIRKRLDSLKSYKENLLSMKDDEIGSHPYTNQYHQFPHYPRFPQQNMYQFNPYMMNNNMVRTNMMSPQYFNQVNYSGSNLRDVPYQMTNNIRNLGNIKPIMTNQLKGMPFKFNEVETGQPAELKNKEINAKDLLDLVEMVKKKKNSQLY